MNNRTLNSNDIIQKICLFSCLIFLVAHISYLIVFWILEVYQLVYINIGSVSFYLAMLLVVKYKHFNSYVYLVSTEISAYMVFASIVCGPDAGFQITLIGMTCLIFFAGYFSKGNHNYIKPIRISVAYMVFFTFVFIWFKFHEPLAKINDTALSALFASNIIITFGFDITFLAILTSYTVILEKRIEKESVTDKLTNIANRNGLNDYFERIGDQKNNYILAIFDIDNFKLFNDVNGHLCGDYVLKQIACIASNNSKDDFVSRWGGEEFVVISKIDGDIDETIAKLDRIRIDINLFNFTYDNKKLKSTITIGAAKYENDETIDDWIKRADEKLYQGKHNGKNQTVF